MSIFTKVKINRPKRSTFDMSHEVKLTTELGRLTPIFCQEILPNDSIRLNTEIFCRMAPLVAPIMHNVNIYTHFFFVPNRLLWDNWKTFITRGESGTEAPIPPYYRPFALNDDGESFYVGSSSLYDYLGLPAQGDSGVYGSQKQFDRVRDFKVSALPFRAYRLIYDEYYRDQNLEESADFDTSLDGDVTEANLAIGDSNYLEGYRLSRLLYRAWEKDYFTSALPFPQRGTDVLLPIQGTAPVVRGSGQPNFTYINGDSVPNGTGVVIGPTDGNPLHATPGSLATPVPGSPGRDQNFTLNFDPNGSLKADLSQATSTTINDLRRAFSLQRWFERNARAGSRYVEQILSHFGVRVPDYTIQRPVYLGGGKQPLVISEVLQNSATEQGSTPQGNMSGHGASVGVTHQFKHRFLEHGWVIGIMSIVPRSCYFQGVPKQFQKTTFDEYAWPEFAHLGEQEVKYKELFFNPDTQDYNDKTFGYQSRYADYKFINDRVCGDFRNSLDFWHMSRIFSKENPPKLNQTFVQFSPQTIESLNRVFAVQDTNYDHFWLQVYHKCKFKRPLPYYGTPS